MLANRTVNLGALCNSWAKIARSSDLSSRFFVRISSIQNASEQFVSFNHLSFVNFCLNLTPQHESLK